MPESERVEEGPLRVLYLAGFGRSGSSIMGNILGQTKGFFHGGELRNVWDDGFALNRICGCGETFSRCPFWSKVAHRITVDAGLDPLRVLSERDRLGRTRQLPFWLTPGLRRRFEGEAKDLVRWIEMTYRAIRSESGADVLVDSTMSPVYGHLLTQAPNLEVRVVHLVRDPRAVAYSWSKEVLQESSEGVPMQRFDARASAARWVVENLAVQRLLSQQARTRRVRYEDFAAQPAQVVGEIVDFASDGLAAPPPFIDNLVRIDPSHTVWGNQSRFLTGDVEIRSDEVWRNELKAGERRWVELIAGIPARRFGYT